MQEHDESEPVDEIVTRLEAREKESRRKTVIVTALVLIPAILAVIFAWMYRDRVLAPQLDIEGGEKEVLAETDDPQCRSMIASVTQVGEDFRARHAAIEKRILGDDPEALNTITSDIVELRDRLERAEGESGDANLRFETSREELDRWFAHVDNELRLLSELADERIAELEQAEESDEEGDEGPEGEEGAEDKESEAGAPKPASTKTPEERRDGALLAVDDAFESFRVWHTGSLHPCGAADEDEEGWTPERERMGAN